MKILISHSYFLYLDPKEASYKKPYPPLATLYLAAWIQQKLGLDIKFYDVMFDKDEKGLVKCMKQFRPDVFIVYDDDFNYVTKMCLENMRKAIFQVLSQARKSGIFLVHSSSAAQHAHKYLQAGFHFVIHENAEKTICEMLQTFLRTGSEKELKTLKGISFLEKGIFIRNHPQIDTISLDDAPLPYGITINIEPYRNMWLLNHGYFSLNISTSRGCPFNCNWCAKPLYGKTYRAVPARKIAEQFSYLSTHLGADHIWITDDIFALEPDWLGQFTEELEKLDAKIPYKCQNRADLITERFAAQLVSSGCREVWLGVESGSQKVLDAMDKEMTIEHIKKANDLLKRHKIQVGFFLQYGYPGEDITDIKKTLRLIRECVPEYIGISVSYPLKGTSFYKKVASTMGEKKNWEDSGDLALMFPGKYHPDFYRALYKYTHQYFVFISLFKKRPMPKELKRLSTQYKHAPEIVIDWKLNT